MSDHPAPDPSDDPLARPTPMGRRRWRTLLVPMLLLGGLLWVSNWFYQRARLFRGSHIVLGEPYLP